MEDQEITEINKSAGALLQRLGLLGDVPEGGTQEYQQKMVTLNVAVMFPNLSELKRAAIIGAYWATHRATIGVNILTVPLHEEDQAEWEQVVRTTEHEDLPYFQNKLEEMDVRSKLTPFQLKILEDLTRVHFAENKE